MDSSDDEYHDRSDSCEEYTDDSSGEDPDYDVIKKMSSTFSNMSLKRKTKPGIVKGTDEDEENVEVEETVSPELSKEDQKCYEIILTMIEGGQVEKLKIDQCKIYLRKHKLRLAGNKATLIQRIKEHINIVNGGGEKKYPASSFVLNCKGDACLGDIVMFEQNVYEMFNLASRSATGPPCGKRVVAGRIIKESYGAAKQQHTFTVEVLWSNGEKPLPPLHPLLIKGRNLYKLKTLRQRWEDEGEREKILLEKHSRGDLARCRREARIERREMRKMINADRGTRKQNKENTGPVRSRNPEKQIDESKMQQHDLVSNLEDQRFKHKTQYYSKPSGSNLINEGNYYGEPIGIPNTIVPPPELLYQRQQFVRTSNRGFYTGLVSSFQPANLRGTQINDIDKMNLHRVRPHHGNAAQRQHVQAQDYKKKQMCRYYAQGRCHFGDRCKFVHEVSGDKS